MRNNGRHAQMDTPLKSRHGHEGHTGPGRHARSGRRQRPSILGSLTIPGHAKEVSRARAFIARTLSALDRGQTVDSDAATLLTSELVTNAILHTESGAPGGTV